MLLAIDMKTPVRLLIARVDILGQNVVKGMRQESRDNGADVHDCPIDIARVGELIRQVAAAVTVVSDNSLCGDRHALSCIADVIRTAPEREMRRDKNPQYGAAAFVAPKSGEVSA